MVSTSQLFAMLARTGSWSAAEPTTPSNFRKPTMSGLPASPGGVPPVGPSTAIDEAAVASSVAPVTPFMVTAVRP